MAVEEFRASAHQAVDLLADYLAGVERYAVFPPVEPGSLRQLFAAAPPEAPEPVEAILADVPDLILPNVTHWQHPGFFAYFATTASGIGILGELLTAGIGSNAMLWRTSPVATELEGVVVDWLRQALGLPEGLRRADHRHGVHLVADRDRRGARGGGRRTPRRPASAPPPSASTAPPRRTRRSPRRA